MDKLIIFRSVICGLIFSALFLEGCAGTRLYRASDDAVAQKAKNAIIAADLKSALAPERLALKEFNKREQEVVKRDQIGIRDLKLLAFLSGTNEESSWGTLRAEIRARYKLLIGDTKGKDIETQVRLAEDARRKLEPQIQNYFLATQGKIKLQCIEPLPISQQPKPEELELKLSYDVFKDTCTAHIEARKKLDALLLRKGALADLLKRIEKIESEKALLEKTSNKSNENYSDALKESKDAKPEEGKLAIKLKVKFDELISIPKLDALANDNILGGLLEEGKLEQVKQNKAAIDEVIQSLKGNVTADSTPALKRLAAISRFEQALTADPAQPLSALILQAEYLRLEADNIEKRISRGKEKISLLKKKRDAMVDEIMFLNEATNSLDTFEKECPKKPVLYDSFRLATPNCRFLIAQGLSGYVNAVTFGKTEQELIDYQIIELGHDAALDDSETAIAQTDTSIRVPIESLAKIYSEGIKPEDLSNLIHALGLSAIAVRVK
jgi:hypothetical protein